jgi:hypothetical protein
MYLSLSMSVCVPFPVRLCPCLYLSVSLSVFFLVPVCPFPISLSVCVPVPVSLCSWLCLCPRQFFSLSLSILWPCPWPFMFLSLSMPWLFQQTSLATDNFQRLFIAESQRITFKVTLLANGQLSALITPRMNGNGKLSTFILTSSMDQINRSYF